MKILVTGCAGFIASNLCYKLILKGHFIVGIDNFDVFYDRKFKEENLYNLKLFDNFSFFELDIENIDKLDQQFDVVIHLAAKAGVRPSIEKPKEYIDVNIKGSNSVLNYMVKKGIKKLVFGSSSSVYGNCEKIPFSENYDTNQTISPYAFTKKSCELMNSTYNSLYSIDVVNLRFFTVYGPNQRPDLAIYKFTERIFKSKSIIKFGDGMSSRDYTHVNDITDGIISALNFLVNNESVNETFNLGNNYPISLNKLIEILYNEIGKEMNVRVEEKQPGDVNMTYADISKAKRLLGYQPKIGIEEGLKNFIEWFKNNRL
jgi:nucleoside-diphosphate-sugar epimerase